MAYRLPAAPLHRVLVRMRITESLTWSQLADRVGVTERHLWRLLSAPSISERVADRIVCRIGLHPVLLWPDEWLGIAFGGCGRSTQQAAV